jgi:hypothetical protein
MAIHCFTASGVFEPAIRGGRQDAGASGFGRTKRSTAPNLESRTAKIRLVLEFSLKLSRVQPVARPSLICLKWD